MGTSVYRVERLIVSRNTGKRSCGETAVLRAMNNRQKEKRGRWRAVKDLNTGKSHSVWRVEVLRATQLTKAKRGHRRAVEERDIHSVTK